MTPQLAQMHEAVGRAVLWAQVFETVFTVCFELLGMLKSGVSKLIDAKHFKVPTRKLLIVLSSANSIATEFESQINDLIEKRHLLIHRWFQQNGLPGDDDTDDISKLTRLASEVEESSKRISGQLAGYIVSWGKANPAQNILADSERTRLLALFQQAHLGDRGR